MRLRRGVLTPVACAVLAATASAPATAVDDSASAVSVPPSTDQELPFLCGQSWTGTTRANHSPSSLAVDFNRDNDYGRLVLASGSGVVSRVEDAGDTSYGKWIRVEHPDGYSTLYAHLKAQWVVPGQYVDQGTPIGRVGATGGVSGAHLHYEQRVGRDVQPAWFHQAAFVYGSTPASQNCPDVPLAGDWDGDRVADVAAYHRDGRAGTFEMYSPDGAVAAVRLGRAGDLPVSGDWDGDGVTDVGVRRQGARLFILRAADGTRVRKRLGLIRDLPVTGDWDGDGVTDLGVWRPAATRFRLLRADGTTEVVRLGAPGALPVTGDWNGDGVTDLGVFDPAAATFWQRTVGSDGTVTVAPVLLGTDADLPVTGDWNGDGLTDLGVWSPATATWTLRVTPSPARTRSAGTAAPEVRTLVFGRPR